MPTSPTPPIPITIPTTTTPPLPKITPKNIERANEFLHAIKYGTLEKYFESFTDDRVANLCKAGHVKCGTDRSENVKRLIKQIKGNKPSYMKILNDDAYVVLPYLYGIMTGLTALTVSLGMQSISPEFDSMLATERKKTVVRELLMCTTLWAVMTGFVYKVSRSKRRKNKLKTAAKRTNAIQKWYDTIKIVTGGGGRRKSPSKRHHTVRKSLHRSFACKP
jgi:hypothetical protein